MHTTADTAVADAAAAAAADDDDDDDDVLYSRVKHHHHQLTNMPPSIGGPEVDSVVIAAFTALVWHTPTLRQQISRYGTNTL